MGIWWIRWMCSTDLRFSISNKYSKMPRRSWFRRKRRMFTRNSCLRYHMRCWLLERRKWKLHLSSYANNHASIIFSKCLPMPRWYWWIIRRNLSFAGCHCSSTTLTYWIIGNFWRASFNIIRGDSTQSQFQRKETSLTLGKENG